MEMMGRMGVMGVVLVILVGCAWAERMENRDRDRVAAGRAETEKRWAAKDEARRAKYKAEKAATATREIEKVCETGKNNVPGPVSIEPRARPRHIDMNLTDEDMIEQSRRGMARDRAALERRTAAMLLEAARLGLESVDYAEAFEGYERSVMDLRGHQPFFAEIVGELSVSVPRPSAAAVAGLETRRAQAREEVRRNQEMAATVAQAQAAQVEAAAAVDGALSARASAGAAQAKARAAEAQAKAAQNTAAANEREADAVESAARAAHSAAGALWKIAE